MPVYDPTGHPLLSAAAQRLDGGVLLARADAAEALLARGSTRLADTAHEAGTPEYDRAVLAVVYQLNYELEAGTDAEVYGSVQRGSRQAGFRGGALNPMPAVSPRAQAIVDVLLPLADTSAAWPVAGSLR